MHIPAGTTPTAGRFPIGTQRGAPLWVDEVGGLLDPRTYGRLLYQDLPDKDLPMAEFLVGFLCSGEFHPFHIRTWPGAG